MIRGMLQDLIAVVHLHLGISIIPEQFCFLVCKYIHHSLNRYDDYSPTETNLISQNFF